LITSLTEFEKYHSFYGLKGVGKRKSQIGEGNNSKDFPNPKLVILLSFAGSGFYLK
jgi:hypothetical protein